MLSLRLTGLNLSQLKRSMCVCVCLTNFCWSTVTVQCCACFTVQQSESTICTDALLCSVVSYCLLPHGLWPTRLLCPWDFPGQNNEVSCHFLLQRLFPTQGSNLCVLDLLHRQEDSLPTRGHLGSPCVCT